MLLNTNRTYCNNKYTLYLYIYIYQVGDSTAYVGMSWIIYSNVLAENTEYLMQNTSEYLNTCQSSSLYLYSNKDLILGKI